MDLKSWNCYLEELVGAVERSRPIDPSQDPQFINVKSLIKQQKTLDPQLWDGEKLKPEIVDRLIQIARRFFKSLDIGPDTVIKDITLTGSLASFNWSDYSDVDLHILLDFNQFRSQDLIKDLVRNVASNWNNKHDIKIKGYDVEIYVQDANEPHHSLGVYSLLNNRFLKTPQRYNKKIDSEAVKEKANDLMEKIDDIYDLFADHQYALAEKRSDYIIKKIRNYRKSGLEQDGPYAIENLVFKVLRRNGYLKKILDLKTDSYDERMSINYDIRNTINENNGPIFIDTERQKGESHWRYKLRRINTTLKSLKTSSKYGGVVDVEELVGLYKKRRRRRKPSFVVIHTSNTPSPAKTLVTWPGKYNPTASRLASTNFEIDKDGRIYMYLDPANWSSSNAKGDTNPYSIGIDITGLPSDMRGLGPNSPQILAAKRLIRSLQQAFPNIPSKAYDSGKQKKKLNSRAIIKQGIGIIGHKDVADNNTRCPAFNVVKNFADLAKEDNKPIADKEKGEANGIEPTIDDWPAL